MPPGSIIVSNDTVAASQLQKINKSDGFGLFRHDVPGKSRKIVNVLNLCLPACL